MEIEKRSRSLTTYVLRVDGSELADISRALRRELDYMYPDSDPPENSRLLELQRAILKATSF